MLSSLSFLVFVDISDGYIKTRKPCCHKETALCHVLDRIATQVNSRSSILIPNESLHATSFRHSIQTTSLSCMVRFRDIADVSCRNPALIPLGFSEKTFGTGASLPPVSEDHRLISV